MTTNPAAVIAKGHEPYDKKKHGSLYPRALPATRVVQALHQAGFPESEWVTGVAIARRESALVPELIGAVNPETREVDPENSSWDFGLFQISYRWNSHLLEGSQKIGEWDDPDDNAKIAKHLFDESVRRGHSGWRPWHTYTSGNYQTYIPLAEEAVAEYKRSETYGAISPTRPEDAVIEKRSESRYTGLKIETQSQVGLSISSSSADTTQGVVIHHPAASSLTLGSHDTCRAQVRNWDSYHRSKGWNGLGYNFALCHHGILMTGRGLRRQGAHAPGANATHVGLLVMVETGKHMTPDQVKGLKDTLTWLRHEGVNSSNITPHSFWVSTSCPGDILRAQIRSGEWVSGGNVPDEKETPVSDNKLKVDGVLGPRTISELQRSLNEGRF